VRLSAAADDERRARQAAPNPDDELVELIDQPGFFD
jgi:hypothetical protein